MYNPSSFLSLWCPSCPSREVNGAAHVPQSVKPEVVLGLQWREEHSGAGSVKIAKRFWPLESFFHES